MAYTVTLPGGLELVNYVSYVRGIREVGIDRGQALRTLSPEADGRWLPVWSDRKDAERFAEVLKKIDRKKKWQVQEVAPEQVSEGPLGPVEIYVGWQSDGYAYDVTPNSRWLIQPLFPEAHLVPGVFVRTRTKEEFETTQLRVIDHVVQILTGLNLEQLQRLGGYRIFDPTREKVLYSTTLQPVQCEMAGQQAQALR